MSHTSAILTMQSDLSLAIERSIQGLNQAGFQVLRSFDLNVARAAHVECACPHHGTDQCDCQMVVLLIYGLEGPPVTLVVHGYDGQTNISLIDAPEQRPASKLVKTIVQSITATVGPRM